ncbi:MAG: HlyD family efflux transporter periplasmic adaptor subunit [Lacunisphaera sp.]
MMIPAAFAENTVESLFAEMGPERPWIYRFFLVGVIAALASLPLIEVDVAVRAPGILRSATERVELRPATSGPIVRVLAHDNEQVQAGQALLVVSSADLDERLARNQALQEEHAGRIADLQRITSWAAEPRLDDKGMAPEGLLTAAIAREWAAYLAQLEADRLAETKAANDEARYAVLAGKGIATRQEWENARYEVQRLQAESRLLQTQALTRWQSRLQDEATAQAELVSEEQRLAEEQVRYTVRSPVAGVLVGFTGWSPGGFVGANQLLGAVSPDDTLLVETQVSSRDAGLVRVGQRVRLQIDAYAYTWWGALDGVVTAIGGDALIADRATPPGFKVLVRPAATHLTLPNGARAELKKGLTLSARLLVARRSLLQLLYDESSAWLNPQDRRPT